MKMILVLILACVGLTGCFGTLVYDSAEVRLCKVVDANGWTDRGDRGDKELKIDDVTYVVDISDDGSAGKTTGPIKDVFWVRVNGLTVGSAIGMRAPPMVYDPSAAVITVGGRTVKALPRAWQGGFVNGGYHPVKEIRVPIDLNTEDQQMLLGHFIAFPMKPPNVKDTYTMLPGIILLDGKTTPLPSERSCYTESKLWWNPIH